MELKDKPKANHYVYSSKKNNTVVAVFKAVQRDLLNYIRVLIPIILRYIFYIDSKKCKIPKKEKPKFSR